MSNLVMIAASVKEELSYLAEQSERLAQGLQNVAPDSGVPNNSIEYLQAISDTMKSAAENCEKKFNINPSRDIKL